MKITHWDWYKPFYIMGLFVIVIILIINWYEDKYPCVYGHNEQQWVNQYSYYNGQPQYIGGYFTDVFICDCRTTKDSIEYYKSKHNENK